LCVVTVCASQLAAEKNALPKSAPAPVSKNLDEVEKQMKNVTVVEMSRQVCRCAQARECDVCVAQVKMRGGGEAVVDPFLSTMQVRANSFVGVRLMVRGLATRATKRAAAAICAGATCDCLHDVIVVNMACADR
jgi:hypothetical protein